MWIEFVGERNEVENSHEIHSWRADTIITCAPSIRIIKALLLRIPKAMRTKRKQFYLYAESMKRRTLFGILPLRPSIRFMLLANEKREATRSLIARFWFGTLPEILARSHQFDCANALSPCIDFYSILLVHLMISRGGEKKIDAYSFGHRIDFREISVIS